jgi:uncharacterized protein (TIGR02001 family)
MQHKPLSLLAGAAAVALACPWTGVRAQAAEEASQVAAAPLPVETLPQAATASAAPLTANLTLASQYVSRGFRQTWGKPAVQGGVDYAWGNGFSVGTWASSVSSKFIEGASTEWDVYAGYSMAVGDLTYGATLYYYAYPGARISATGTSYNYGELMGSVAWKWLTLKYFHTYTRNYFGFEDDARGLHSRGSGYLDLTGNFELGDGLALSLHAGHQRVKNFGDYSFRDARAALSKSLDGGWTVTGAYTRAWARTDVYDHYTTGALDSSGQPAVSNPTKGTFVVSLTRSF